MQKEMERMGVARGGEEIGGGEGIEVGRKGKEHEKNKLCKG